MLVATVLGEQCSVISKRKHVKLISSETKSLQVKLLQNLDVRSPFTKLRLFKRLYWLSYQVMKVTLLLKT